MNGIDEEKGYFFDSYAVIEVVFGNESYAKFKEVYPIITVFNLAEIYWSALKNLGEKEANLIYEKYSQCVEDVSEIVLKKAMKFKIEHKEQRLSYADCIGYIYSRLNNLIFLTGDKEFEGMSGVEFIK